MKPLFRLRILLLPLLLLVMPFLACGPCGLLNRRISSAPHPPDRTIHISDEAAQRFEQKLRTAWENQEDGHFRLQVTEEELTSYVNLKLHIPSQIPISEPRIWFSQGKIFVSGRISSPDVPISGQALIVLSAWAAEGRINTRIESASIGQVPVPQSFLDTLTELLEENLSQVQTNLRIEKLQLSEGEVLIVATQEKE